MGYTKREMYIQFLTRIHCEIPQVVLANFSKLKNLQAPMFSGFPIFFERSSKNYLLHQRILLTMLRGNFQLVFLLEFDKKERFELH
jgi:hypothetical protein